ncbi:MAG: ATP-grasp domain-containing protein [Bacillota bacterium]|nr:ATP-grasp domain-containing protein [Bacillota bacterium]
MRALVTTPSSPVSLFFVRRLKQMGYTVTAIDSHRRSFASYSNAVSKTIIAPSLRYDPHGFAQAVLDELKREDYDFYLPVLECSFLMSYYQDEIKQYTNMISMPYRTIVHAHNKDAMRTYAADANVRMPRTQAPQSLKEAFRMLETVEGPIVIKPPVACNAHGQKIVLDPKNALWEYGQLVKEQGMEKQLPIIQQYIKGSLISTVNLAVSGEIKGNVVFRALRTVPTSGGTSSYRETVSSPEAELFDARLIQHFNWTGFISFDYMEDAETGELYLIDCNPRIAPGAILGYFAGVDLVGAFIQLLQGKDISLLPKQEHGVRCKLQFLDLGWLVYNLIDKELSGQEKLRCIKTWAKREKSYNDIEDIHDLRPWFALWAFLLRNLGRLLGSDGGEIFLEHSLFEEETFERGFKESAATII